MASIKITDERLALAYECLGSRVVLTKTQLALLMGVDIATLSKRIKKAELEGLPRTREKTARRNLLK